MDQFIIKDSGERQKFDSGMVRDAGNDKVRYNRLLDGPMLKRWAAHLHKGAKKYPDVAPGVPNWTLASGPEELQRFKESAFSHFMAWLDGLTDEDHAAGVFFNINGVEYVREIMKHEAAMDAIFQKFWNPPATVVDSPLPQTPADPVPMTMRRHTFVDNTGDDGGY